ncbi:MAG: protein kinase [Marinagarivorans sp.]|nr:protein kinase [Marinagarivorans sp.]
MSNQDEPPKRNDATRVVPKKTTASPIVNEKTIARPITPAVDNATDIRKTLATDNRDEALTRFNNALKQGNTTTGFKHAKDIANAALAANKIILKKRFVLESVIGTGGMGTVYLAKDLRKIEANDPKPFAAVKVLNDDFKNHTDAFVTLQREASRSHTLSHPNIVTVHDFDRDGDTIFMTMEFLEGEPLDSLIDRMPNGLPIEQATKIIKDFCEALIHAHSKGIIHSDLKPGNIFATKSNAKVLDFGIARSVSNATIVGDFDAGSLGALTPSYATLEMFEGAEPAPSDDVYAAAIIAYQLLTGKHPYNNISAQDLAAKEKAPKLIKPEGISKHQWLALESALAIHRKDRTHSIKFFLDTFTHVKKFPYFKVISATLFCAVGVLGFLIYNAPNEVATAIENTYLKAEQCAQTEDLDCAIESSRAVLELEPTHLQATQLLTQTLAKQSAIYEADAKTDTENCIENGDLNCAQEVLARLKNRVPQSTEITTIETAIDNLSAEITLSNLIDGAQYCLKNNDFNCAQEAYLKAEILAPNNTQVQVLKQNIDKRLNEHTASIAEFEQRIASIISSAQKCLNQKNYTCAINKSDEALKLDASNTSALTIKQRALSDASQQKENTKSAEKLYQKASACFEKRNYTCAIANSESALEFSPSYKPAKDLIQKSRKKIETLKSSLKIN